MTDAERKLLQDEIRSLTDKLVAAEAETARWKDEYATAQVEHIAMRDRHSIATKEKRQRDEATYAAAEQRAKDQALHYVLHAIRGQVEPLRSFLKHAATADSLTAAERRALAASAERHLRDLDRDPDASAALRVVADMKAVHERLSAEKTDLWNKVQAAYTALGGTR